jgi:hypothetical protein
METEASNSAGDVGRGAAEERATMKASSIRCQIGWRMGAGDAG